MSVVYKRGLCLLVVLLLWWHDAAAQNLVLNPSFEDTIRCPYDGRVNSANCWTIEINTADVFNPCDTGIYFSIPSNYFGFQQPATDNSYAGFYANGSTPESNEFLGAELLSPLVKGNKYFISFKVSLSKLDSYIWCGVDKIGLLFTNTDWGVTLMFPPPFLNNYPHVYTNDIISDTSSWVTIKGSFIADSAYRYFIIGHFFDRLHTNFYCSDSNNVHYRYSYYYVDDVCISTDSLTCASAICTDNNICTADTFINCQCTFLPIVCNDNDTCTIDACDPITGCVYTPYLKCVVGLPAYQTELFSVYPNAASGLAVIRISALSSVLTIYDIMGNEIYHAVAEQKELTLNVSAFPNGVYFLRAQTKETFQVVKFLIRR